MYLMLLMEMVIVMIKKSHVNLASTLWRWGGMNAGTVVPPVLGCGWSSALFYEFNNNHTIEKTCILVAMRL